MMFGAPRFTGHASRAAMGLGCCVSVAQTGQGHDAVQEKPYGLGGASNIFSVVRIALITVLDDVRGTLL